MNLEVYGKKAEGNRWNKENFWRETAQTLACSYSRGTDQQEFDEVGRREGLWLKAHGQIHNEDP